ncbi:MAG TPA: 3-oxoacyl-[acyl-carrier-protein] reductase, partial [Acidobacteriota bacterium]
GASRGIGYEIARVLIRQGCRVAMVARSREALDKSSALIEAESVNYFAQAADISDEQQVRMLFKTVLERWGRVDYLVNNAGVTRDGLLLRMKRADWDAVLNINLTGVFHCTREALQSMVRNRFGRIVNITSVVAQTGNAGQSNYIASKAGVIGFTRAIAREVASRNITVNAVAPGYIDTEMTQALPEAARQSLLAMIPLRRIGTAADVAASVKFLLSDEAGYITGHVLNVNGGMYMGG